MLEIKDLHASVDGNVILKGIGTEDDGSYSVNGEAYSPIPPFSFPFPLSATSP